MLFIIFHIIPELNPIEYIFSLLRKQLLSSDNFSFDCVIKIIVNFIKTLNIDSIKNIFDKCFNEINLLN